MPPPLTVSRAVLLGGSLLALSVFLKHTMGSRQPAALEGRICGWLERDLNTSDYSLSGRGGGWAGWAAEGKHDRYTCLTFCA